MTQQSLSGAADVRRRAHASDSFTVLTGTTERERKVSLQGTSHLPDAVPHECCAHTDSPLCLIWFTCWPCVPGKHPEGWLSILPDFWFLHSSRIHRDCIGLHPHQTSIHRTQKCVSGRMLLPTGSQKRLKKVRHQEMRLYPNYSFPCSCQLVMTTVSPKAEKLGNPVSFSSVQAGQERLAELQGSRDFP